MSSPYDTIKELNETIDALSDENSIQRQNNYQLILINIGMVFVFSIVISFVLWYANGLRINNIEKNKKLEELQKYKCAWEDFNKTHIPETCLQRLPEIEAIYNERK